MTQRIRPPKRCTAVPGDIGSVWVLSLELSALVCHQGALGHRNSLVQVLNLSFYLGTVSSSDTFHTPCPPLVVVGTMFSSVQFSPSVVSDSL